MDAYQLGQVGPEWKVAGLGGFDGSDTSDMILRDSNNGAFEVYDISNNNITNAVSMGQVGLEWTVSGFADFSSKPSETDMLMRNSNTGQFELYDICERTAATGLNTIYSRRAARIDRVMAEVVIVATTTVVRPRGRRLA